MNATRLRAKNLIMFALLAGLALSCSSVYYNTFFNAKTAFDSAEKTRKRNPNRRPDQRNYEIAIDKSMKVIDDYPNSKYYDDALFVIGVSYYYTGQPRKADRRFRELLANYEESEFIRDATVYMAKTKLEIGDDEGAMAIFEEIFAQDYSRENKTEAAMSLAQYYKENEDHELATNYYQAIRDSLGDDTQRLMVQGLMADSYFELFKFGDALGAYLQLLGMDPSNRDRYHALFQAATCAFRLQRIATGMDYLSQLIEDEVYYDSLSSLNLAVAEGYELDGDLELAIDLYALVAEDDTRRKQAAFANYRLGLIEQFDYDNLYEAKKYYDKAITAGRTSDIGKDAFQRSIDIGKLQSFREAEELDSAATSEMLDQAAYNQFLLAELYWFSLDKPDSAILEMQFMVDSFPDSYDAPSGMIALSQMYREHYQDSARADSILKVMITKYPHSDYMADGLAALGLTGTAADTGYAEYYLHQAENFLVDEDNVDSARANYQIIVDQFPDSKHVIKARFNLILMTELYENPGDSSVYFAYKEFVDSFPGNTYALEASSKIRSRVGSARQRQEVLEAQEEEVYAEAEEEFDDSQPASRGQTTAGGGYTSALQKLYERQNGKKIDTIVLLDLTPVETVEPFEFPESAFSLEDNYIQIFFHILLDFSATVLEIELKTPSQYDEINDRATRTVGSMVFNPADVSTLVAAMDLRENEDGQGYWFVYKYIVKKPEFIR